jgi:hypothetical protein
MTNVNISSSYLDLLSYRNDSLKTVLEALQSRTPLPMALKNDKLLRNSAANDLSEKLDWISSELLYRFNTALSLKKSGDVWEVDGVKFLTSQIPPIQGDFSEIKAVGNVMDFGAGYFQYVSPGGGKHTLVASVAGHIKMPTSEYERGMPYPGEEVRKYIEFWNYLMIEDHVYINLSFTKEEILGYFADAGIKPGPFVVKMGNREMFNYYSEGPVGIPVSKRRYDEMYNSMTNGFLFMFYQPGDVFTVGNKEYVLTENHTLDVPYGEDLFNLKEPSNYKFGMRIE